MGQIALFQAISLFLFLSISLSRGLSPQSYLFLFRAASLLKVAYADATLELHR